MVTSSNVVFFYLTFLRLVCRCHHRQRRRLQPACFLGRFTICTTSPERRPGARTKHAPAIIDLKMFDNEVSGLRWFVFTSFQTKRKQQRTQRVKCSLCFPFFFVFYSAVSSSQAPFYELQFLGLVVCTRFGKSKKAVGRIWKEKEAKEKKKKICSPHKYCGLRSRQINK